MSGKQVFAHKGDAGTTSCYSGYYTYTSYDQIIKRKKSCVVTYIDYTAAFDSISHKFMDSTLADAGASRKSRAIFRAIYKAATGMARVKGVDGRTMFSQSFEIGRGVIQGDIISPVLFILALDQIMQKYDQGGPGKGGARGKGLKCGRMLRLKVLGYADDAALVDGTVESMSTRLTTIGDSSLEHADMKINASKTFSQHVHEREDIKVTLDEVAAVESKYDNKCDYCERRFKTRRGMLIHRAKCQYNYDATEEIFILDKIVGVFGFKHSRWFKVKWRGYPEAEWEREHLLVRDGCTDSIRNFWAESDLHPQKDFYPDPGSFHRCTVCTKTFRRAQDLKAHRTRQKHHEKKNATTTKTAVKEAVLKKRTEMQKELPKVKWGELEIENSWRFKYLGSIFEAGGGCMADVRTRIAMARQRFGKMRHIWHDNELHANLRQRLYKACICSMLTYGSEAWNITPAISRALDGANVNMMSIIPGKTQQQEPSSKWWTFDLVRWVRGRRLQ